MSQDLIAFIRTRLDEDEQVARECLDNALDTGEWEVEDWHPQHLPRVKRRHTIHTIVEAVPDEAGAHISRHDPARVLQDVQAKRQLIIDVLRYEQRIDGEWGCCHEAEDIAAGFCRSTPVDSIPALRTLAVCWSGHPDYRPEWRPA